jgi:hypothetical protein
MRVAAKVVQTGVGERAGRGTRRRGAMTWVVLLAGLPDRTRSARACTA